MNKELRDLIYNPTESKTNTNINGTSYQLTTGNAIQFGWKCPVCNAVMSPWTSVCVNCHGNSPYTYPGYPWTITCEVPKVHFSSETKT